MLYKGDLTTVPTLQMLHDDVMSESPPHAERPKQQKLEVTISPVKNIPTTRNNESIRDIILQQPNLSFKDIGGMDKTLENVCNMLLHIRHPELYRKLGISPPRGFLLHGPPGCGKTLLANAIAGEFGMKMIKTVAFQIVSAVSGESEELIRKLFERARRSAPCILFIDEIDAIAANRRNVQKGIDQRIMAQLLNCLDDLGILENDNQVLVIGATNKPEAIDPALRRPGRLNVGICLGIPSVKSREDILRVLTSNVTLSPEFDVQKIARCTPGYVGADLSSLIQEAAMIAVNRVLNGIKEQYQNQILVPPRAAKVQSNREPLSKKRTHYEAAKKPKNAEAPLNTKKMVDEDMPETEELKDKDWSVSDAVVVENIENSISEQPLSAEPQKGATSIFERTDGAASALLADVDPDIVVKEESQPSHSPYPVEKVKVLTTVKELQSWLGNRSPLSDEQLAGLSITMDDFDEALKKMQPSAKWEGFPGVPDTTWDDVGSLRNIKEQLQMAILAPLRNSEQFGALGLTVPVGVLLCGPSGCGKSLLANAVANEAGINFISIKGPELLNTYVGESERAVRICFERARNCAPCIIFFDEIDALCPKKSDSREGRQNGNFTKSWRESVPSSRVKYMKKFVRLGVMKPLWKFGVYRSYKIQRSMDWGLEGHFIQIGTGCIIPYGDATRRVVNQMLIEMDKVNERKGIFLLAATNRLDNIDPRILRPGRLNKILDVGLPSGKDRVDILRAITKNGTQPKLDKDVDLISIGTSEKLKGYTGGDLAALVREASVLALKDFIMANGSNKSLVVSSKHFIEAIEVNRPSAPEKCNFRARRAKLQAQKEKRIKLNEKKMEWLRRQKILKRARTTKFREQQLGLIKTVPLKDSSPHSTSKGDPSTNAAVTKQSNSDTNYTLNNSLLQGNVVNNHNQSTLIASENLASYSPLNFKNDTQVYFNDDDLKQQDPPPFSPFANLGILEAVPTTFEDQAIKQENSEEVAYFSDDSFIGQRDSAKMYGTCSFLRSKTPLVCEKEAKASGIIGDCLAGCYYGSTQAPVRYNPEIMDFRDVSSLKDPGKNYDTRYIEQVVYNDRVRSVHTPRVPLSQSEFSGPSLQEAHHLSVISQAHMNSSNLLYKENKERLSQELAADSNKIVDDNASTEKSKVIPSKSIQRDDRLIADSLLKTQLPLKKRKLTEDEQLSIYIQKFKEEKELQEKLEEQISYSAQRQMSIADLQRDFPKVKTLAARKLYPDGTGAFSGEQHLYKYPQFSDFDDYLSKRSLMQVYINGTGESSSSYPLCLMIGSMHSCINSQASGTAIDGNQYSMENQNQPWIGQEIPQAFNLQKPALREQLPQNRLKRSIKQTCASLDTPLVKRGKGRPRKNPK